jgi:hypothetical protein
MVETQGNSIKVSSPEAENAIFETSCFPSEFMGLIFVRYLDHVIFNRASALVMKPQIRETVGWLVYECDYYITLTWDRDAEPPTLIGGDSKASGLVLLKTDIQELKRLEPLKNNCYCHLNSAVANSNSEYALKPTERKTLKERRD